MAQSFNLENIRTLLTKAFTDGELRRLCYDNSEFKPVYERLAEGMGKDRIIDKLMEYAERDLLLDTLLELVKGLKPVRYELHQPYHTDRTEPTASATMPPGIPPPPKPYEEHPYPAQAHFTGRIQERTALTAWLTDSENPLQAIIAIGGMGKSALSWHWLQHDLVEQGLEKWGLDGVLWWSFYDQASGFDRFLERAIAYASSGQMDTTGWSTRERMDALRALLQEKRFLLILDGAERLLRAYARIDAAYIEDPAEDDVGAYGHTPTGAPDRGPQESPRQCAELNVSIFLPWLAGLKPSKTLLTSRLFPRELEGIAGVKRTDLTHINPTDAVTFFRAMGIRGTRSEIRAACAPYGYLPLALRLLGGLVAEDPARPGDIAVATEYEIAGDLRGKERHHILERAYDALDTQGRELLSRIAAFRATVEYDMVRTLFGPTSEEPDEADTAWRFASERALKDTLRRLLKRGLLLREEGTSRYDLHPVVRRYVYDRLRDKEETHRRLRDYFATIPTPERVEKLDELAPVIELYHHTVRAGQYDEAMDLFYKRISEATYYQFGAYQLRIELLGTLFPDGEDHPPRLENKSAQGWTLNALANSYSLSGQPTLTVPLYKGYIAISERQEDELNLAIGLGNLAHMAQLYIGALRAAEANLRRSITLCQQIEDEVWEAVGHQELGRLLASRGVWDEAEAALTTALALFEKQQHVQAQGIIWAYRSLQALLQARAVKAAANLTTGLLAEALTTARRALELAEERQRIGRPNARDFTRAHWLLGAAYRVNGKLADADNHLTKALTRCRRINLVGTEANILLDLARLRAAQGQREEAMSLAQEALLITERSGYVLQGADVHLFLAQMALEAGDKAKAKALAQRAHQLATCDGPPDYTYKVAYDEAEALLAQLD